MTTDQEEIAAIALIGRQVWDALKNSGHLSHDGFAAGGNGITCLCGETITIPAGVTR